MGVVSFGGGVIRFLSGRYLWVSVNSLAANMMFFGGVVTIRRLLPSEFYGIFVF